MQSSHRIARLAHIEKLARRTQMVLRDARELQSAWTFPRPALARAIKLTVCCLAVLLIVISATVWINESPLLVLIIALAGIFTGIASSMMEQAAKTRWARSERVAVLIGDCKAALQEMKRLHAEVKNCPETGYDATQGVAFEQPDLPRQIVV